MPIRIDIDPRSPDEAALRRACESLGQGWIVAFPTDTLYGLAVDPRNHTAVARLVRVKGRPSGQPFPLIAADVEQVERLLGPLSPVTRRLAANLWPGPLTLVISARATLASDCLGAGASAAVRVPAHVVARALARMAGHPLTATSANRSGETAPRASAELSAAVGDAVAVILDAGQLPGGAPSTIVDARGERPKLVRQGAVPWARVLESLP